MDSLLVPNVSSITGKPLTVGNLRRSESCTKNYYSASQHTRNVRNEYNFLRFRQPCSKHFYKGNEERFTYQECNRKFVVAAASEPSFESNPNALNPKDNSESIKRFWDAFVGFCHPFILLATTLSITSACFLGVEKLSDISSVFVIGVLQAIIPKIFMTTYICGLNQLCDVEIDKINKPYRPLVTGALSYTNGVTIIVSCLIMSLWLGLMVGSWPSLWVLISTGIIGTAYSVHLPFLRWKKYPALTGMSYVVIWAFIIPILYRLHIQDIYDIEGDQAFGIQTIAVRLGEKKMFWGCISLLEIAYGVAILAGATSSYLWSKIITSIGHAALASILLYRARSVDLKSKDSIMSIYMFIWKLLYVEFFLLPLLR